jgi:hypothetical protein
VSRHPVRQFERQVKDPTTAGKHMPENRGKHGAICCRGRRVEIGLAERVVPLGYDTFAMQLLKRTAFNLGSPMFAQPIVRVHRWGSRVTWGRPNRRCTFGMRYRALAYRVRCWACPCPTESYRVEEWVIRTRSPWLIDRSPSCGFGECSEQRSGRPRTLAKK